MYAPSIVSPAREVVRRTRVAHPFALLDASVWQLRIEDVPVVGAARVLLGAYRGKRSPLGGSAATVLLVSLEPGERWTYRPPEGHDVAWVAVREGALRTSGRVSAGELAVFSRGDEPIDFLARGKTVFLIGSASRPEHPGLAALVHGRRRAHGFLA